jgi:hypothetical protein
MQHRHIPRAAAIVFGGTSGAVSHFPFALVRVSGDYNYIRSHAREIGVWFRHLRSVDDIRYYGDFVTDARSWEQITMTATITPLRESATALVPADRALAALGTR